ncbi:DegV family protein [Sporanaerobacter sp. PP17-6a]|uniref:DegV family protein n=1 Tax=Sporanaerobacter sp. PP17-6a TaxID=1891289 RepID=UPI00089F9302|nr:DegV family protein [Sporanaerobacter sp. PP17-6a]SCL94364.1 DegV domain-containing protein [Sporanaerobacter sp. PP17-6a]
MTFKIVADSSCDLNEELKKEMNISLVPLKIDIGEKCFIDDENLNIENFLYTMGNSKTGIRTSSPSPADFMKAYEGGDEIFVVTLSSQLSSTYNNAVLAKKLTLESTKKFIHIFDSLSASIGETLVSMKIFELIQKKYDKYEIVRVAEEYIKEMKTYFILENLDNLIKAGRLHKIAGRIASLLSFKPIMGSDGSGNVKLFDNVRGAKRAFNRLVEIIGENGYKFENKILGIAHCDALEKAEALKAMIEKKYNFKEIIILKTGGLSSAYADKGGIVLAF